MFLPRAWKIRCGLAPRNEKEGMVARIDFVEGGNGRFHVGDDFAIDRDEVAATGQFAKAFAGQG